MKRIAIFASGSGTNAQNIIMYFRHSGNAGVSLVLSNKPTARVLTRARHLGVPAITFDRKTFYETYKVKHILREHQIDLIVLAGFLWLIPDYLVKEYAGRIVNIHPALLPKYGGKGMYGEAVHRAVIEAGETESGITIHFVNEKYDEGSIIFQAVCKVEKTDSPETLAQKVHQLEYEHYPRVIEELLTKI